MTKPKRMLTTVPFSGFYNTSHEALIDDTVERMFSDRATGCHRNEGLEAKLQELWDFSKVMEAYCKAYTAKFAEGAVVTLHFDDVDSPKEYNFTTDRIFAYITLKDVKSLFTGATLTRLKALVKETFTSRSGFISSYSNDLKEWGRIETWDHNQVGTLLQAYADEHMASSSVDGFDMWAEHALMEDAQSNGHLDNWVCEGADKKKLDQLFTVHDYLERRKERAKAVA